MRKFSAAVIWVLLFYSILTPSASATFYGEIKKGYQYVERKGSSYQVYVPLSFSQSGKAPLIFVFGRSQRDSVLSREQLKDYAALWAEEAEKRGAVIVAPYWEPVVVEGHQHTEKFFLEILEEVRLTYNSHPKKVIVVGYGVGALQAFSLAAFYPDKFGGVATIAGSPLRDRVIGNLMRERLVGGLPPGRLPPVLLVHGENDGILPISLLEEDKAFLEKRGNKVELKRISEMGHEQDRRALSAVFDWFESVERA